MKVWILAASLAALALGACQKKAEWPAAAADVFKGHGARGRYVAVGIYAPGVLWEQLAPAPAADGAPAPDPAGATLKDDDQIIVTLDSASGELRQCGNLSGHCIGFNPWAKPLRAGQSAPTALQKHMQQLQEEADAAAKAEIERSQRP